MLASKLALDCLKSSIEADETRHREDERVERATCEPLPIQVPKHEIKETNIEVDGDISLVADLVERENVSVEICGAVVGQFEFGRFGRSRDKWADLSISCSC